MPPWFPRSTFGIVLVVLYVAVAIFVVRSDRNATGGGWITLHGMGTSLITFPVSVVGENLGMRPDYRRNSDMIFAIGLTAMGVYFAGAGLARLTAMLVTTSETG